jgi:hypothetical protein
MAPFNYVYVTPAGHGWESAEIVYTLPFAEAFEPSPDKPTALLKGTYQHRLFSNRTSDAQEVNIKPHETAKKPNDTSNIFTPARLPVAEHTPLSTCYLNGKELEKSAFEEGDPLEVYNPDNGRRTHFELQGRAWVERGTIAIGNVIRDSLRVISKDERAKDGWGERLGIRKPVMATFPEQSVLDRIKEHVGKRFVDYNRINLQVRPGLDIDEERRVVRLEEDTQKLLGVETGDRLVVEWGGEKHTVQCLDTPESVKVTSQSASTKEASERLDEGYQSILAEDHSSNHIYMPSNVRKAVNTCIGDMVKVRRNMRYTMGKTVSLSILGILAALIFGRPIYEAVIRPVSQWGVTGAALTAIRISIGVLGFLSMSLLLVWILMYPERQEVRM